MNRLDEVFSKKKDILNIYFTAGYPSLTDTTKIIQTLEEAGADMIEIGMPYSDPLADGPTIQESNMQALDNGMTMKVLFEQLKDIRKISNIPLILMGYLNPVMQYGMENFLASCKEVGVDGLILPDLPLPEYTEFYKDQFEAAGIHNIFLITPQTSEKRIEDIDSVSNSFVYMVSSNSITGAKTGVSDSQVVYFDRINKMNLKSPRLIGFGISNNATYKRACEHSNGAIIGSAFIKLLQEEGDMFANIKSFVKSIKEG